MSDTKCMRQTGYTNRWITPAAQGVLVWTRKLAGRRFWFTYVYAGWWGVGETGTLTVSAERPGLEGYPEYRYTVHEFTVADPDATRDRLFTEQAAQGFYLRLLTGKAY